jgi:hypothetical protein
MTYLEGNDKQLAWRGRTQSHSEEMERYDTETKQGRGGPYGYSQTET